MRKLPEKPHMSLLDLKGRNKNESDFFEESRILRSQSEHGYLQQITEQPFETVEGGTWCKGMPIFFRPIQSVEQFIEIEFMLENGEMLIYPFRLQSTDAKYQKLLEVLQVQRIEEALCKEIYLYVKSVPESGHRLLKLEDIGAINE